jgi:WD40 repeat protein
VQRTDAGTFNRGATAMAFHPSGRWLAASSLAHSACIWDLERQQLANELPGHSDTVTCVAYSPDGRWLVSGSDDRAIRIWDAVTHEMLGVHVLDTPIKAVAFSPDSQSLFTANGNTTSYQLSVPMLLEERA